MNRLAILVLIMTCISEAYSLKMQRLQPNAMKKQLDQCVVELNHSNNTLATISSEFMSMQEQVRTSVLKIETERRKSPEICVAPEDGTATFQSKKAPTRNDNPSIGDLWVDGAKSTPVYYRLRWCTVVGGEVKR